MWRGSGCKLCVGGVWCLDDTTGKGWPWMEGGANQLSQEGPLPRQEGALGGAGPGVAQMDGMEFPGGF